MVEIKIVAEAAAPVEQTNLNDDIAFEATEGETVLARALCRRVADRWAIVSLEAQDGLMTDALLRAILHAAGERGVKTAAIEDETLRQFAEKAGYVSDAKIAEIKIPDFFENHGCKG
ncbi:MAG: hypothetical protein IJU16_07910 [Clostridia bacterium]|nr:hypothetical protein [Clostridia bacterium]